jgi:ABC-type lipoprotein release transport system permease subunit
MALGASRADWTRRVLLQGAVITLAGLAVGSVLARYVAVRIADQLHEVPPSDLVTWITVPAFVTLVSLASVYSAARLASRIDPAVLLKTE